MKDDDSQWYARVVWFLFLGMVGCIFLGQGTSAIALAIVIHAICQGMGKIDEK